MARKTNWRAGLNEFLKANQHRPFEWGEWDCCIGLMAGACEVVTGVDYGEPYRGRYSDEKGAFRALRRIGKAKTPSDLMTSFFGAPDHPAFALTGDVVSHNGCIGIFDNGEGVFIGCEMLGGDLARDGLVRVPRGDLEACWHV